MHEIKILVDDCEVDSVTFEGDREGALEEAYLALDYWQGEGYEARATLDGEDVEMLK